mgnify:CR=1 FL=1
MHHLAAKDVEIPVKSKFNNGSFYGSLAAGFALFQDGTVDVKNNPSGDAELEMDTGYSCDLRLGYDFGSFRVEGDLFRIQADVSSLETGTGDVSVNSEYSSYGLMVNGLWDFDLKPFVVSAGLGLGFSNSKFDQMANSGFIAVAESEQTVFTGQFILSASYNLSENASVGVGYRYQIASGFDDSGYVDTLGGGESDISFDPVNASIFEVMFTYRF